jgi:hypothetical protein
LNVFLEEANLPSNTGEEDDSVTLEKILDQKRLYDLTLNFEKVDVDETQSWTSPGRPKARDACA